MLKDLLIVEACLLICWCIGLLIGVYVLHSNWWGLLLQLVGSLIGLCIGLKIIRHPSLQ
jgi:F0F1-type ATP synthase assembly protein I